MARRKALPAGSPGTTDSAPRTVSAMRVGALARRHLQPEEDLRLAARPLRHEARVLERDRAAAARRPLRRLGRRHLEPGGSREGVQRDAPEFVPVDPHRRHPGRTRPLLDGDAGHHAGRGLAPATSRGEHQDAGEEPCSRSHGPSPAPRPPVRSPRPDPWAERLRKEAQEAAVRSPRRPPARPRHRAGVPRVHGRHGACDGDAGGAPLRRRPPWAPRPAHPRRPGPPACRRRRPRRRRPRRRRRHRPRERAPSGPPRPLAGARTGRPARGFLAGGTLLGGGGRVRPRWRRSRRPRRTAAATGSGRGRRSSRRRGPAPVTVAVASVSRPRA